MIAIILYPLEVCVLNHAKSNQADIFSSVYPHDRFMPISIR